MPAKHRVTKRQQAGAATNYVSRRAALRKLQLSLKDFRRLCILKGIYPHEPKSAKKVSGGNSEKKTWFYAKDIDFLNHEPIIAKFRDYKVFLRKVKKAKDKREKEAEERLKESRPNYKLDHIIRERYPTPLDAVRDLDDALCMIFLFARMPTSARVRSEAVLGCIRFSREFLHWVMEARALRKAFVSIKGMYFQADVLGETVTWLVPHQRGQPPPSDVDFQVCATFLQLYNSLMGFLNFYLYQQRGLFYPPRLVQSNESKEKVWEMDGGLGQRLAMVDKVKEEDEAVPDLFLEAQSGVDEARKAEMERIKRLPNLFAGLRFFLGREVPAEPLILIIRSCGGVVSWEGANAPYPVTDGSITHQVYDRPSMPKSDMKRLYIQPQWIFDSLNAGRKLQESDYFPMAVLPPHLSPFVNERPGDYAPPERLEQLTQDGLSTQHLATKANSKTKAPPKKKARTEATQETKTKTVVSEGKVLGPEHPQMAANRAGEEMKLRESMIPKKRRRVYSKIKRGKKKSAREASEMVAKRKAIDGAS